MESSPSLLESVCRFVTRYAGVAQDASSCLHASAEMLAQATSSTNAGVLLPDQIAHMMEEAASTTVFNTETEEKMPLQTALLGKSASGSNPVVTFGPKELSRLDLNCFPGMPVSGVCETFMSFCLHGQSKQLIAVVWVARVISSISLRSASEGRSDQKANDPIFSQSHSARSHDSSDSTSSEDDSSEDIVSDMIDGRSSNDYSKEEKLLFHLIANIVKGVVGHCATQLELEEMRAQCELSTSNLKNINEKMRDANADKLSLEDILDRLSAENRRLLDLEEDAKSFRRQQRCELAFLNYSDELPVVMSKLRVSLGKCIGIEPKECHVSIRDPCASSKDDQYARSLGTSSAGERQNAHHDSENLQLLAAPNTISHTTQITLRSSDGIIVGHVSCPLGESTGDTSETELSLKAWSMHATTWLTNWRKSKLLTQKQKYLDHVEQRVGRLLDTFSDLRTKHDELLLTSEQLRQDNSKLEDKIASLEGEAAAVSQLKEMLETQRRERDQIDFQRKKIEAIKQEQSSQHNTFYASWRDPQAEVPSHSQFASSPSVVSPSSTSTTVPLIDYHRLIQKERALKQEAREHALRETLLEKRLEESQRTIEQQRDQLAQQEQQLIDITEQRLASEKSYQEQIGQLRQELADGKRAYETLAKSTLSTSERFKRILKLTKSVVRS